MKECNGVVKFWKYRIVKNSLDCIPLDKKVVVNTISPNSYGILVRDSDMNLALSKSDFLVLDGLYFGWLPYLVKGIRIKRITGWDCFQFFSKAIDEGKGRVFFLGSDRDTLNRIEEKYQLDFPNVKVGSFSPPFKPAFTEDDDSLMIQKVNAFEPDIFSIGLTAPKQQKWAVKNKERLNVYTISTIGNVFDWYAGNSVRPSVFWQRIGLEWLIRIFLRPEVFKRNIGNQMLFFWHLILIIFRIKKI